MYNVYRYLSTVEILLFLYDLVSYLEGFLVLAVVNRICARVEEGDSYGWLPSPSSPTALISLSLSLSPLHPLPVSTSQTLPSS